MSRASRERQFWVGVASHEHVKIGVGRGFAQLGHGKQAPLKRLHRGDYILYYAPRAFMKGQQTPNPEVKAFVAIGQVTTDVPYLVEESMTFHPYRHDVDYLKVDELPISAVVAQVSFLPEKHWGARFRNSSFSITESDFLHIAKRMCRAEDYDKLLLATEEELGATLPAGLEVNHRKRLKSADGLKVTRKLHRPEKRRVIAPSS